MARSLWSAETCRKGQLPNRHAQPQKEKAGTSGEHVKTLACPKGYRLLCGRDFRHRAGWCASLEWRSWLKWRGSTLVWWPIKQGTTCRYERTARRVYWCDAKQSRKNNTGTAPHQDWRCTSSETTPLQVATCLPWDCKKELQDMLQQGIIEPSSSEWSAPIVLVKKKDGSLSNSRSCHLACRVPRLLSNG